MPTSLNLRLCLELQRGLISLSLADSCGTPGGLLFESLDFVVQMVNLLELELEEW